MEYFSYLDRISYNSGTARNLSQKLKIVEGIDDSKITYIRMNEYDDLMRVAQDIYGDFSLWWILAILNDIKDPFYDIALDDEVINQLARDNTLLYIGVSVTTSLQAGQEIEGQSTGYTGIIKSVSSNAVHTTISIQVTGEKKPISDSVIINNSNSTTYSVVASNASTWMETMFEEYDSLVSENDIKRTIKIIRPEYKSEIIRAIIESVD